MPGLIPEFTQSDINRYIDKFANDKERRAFEVLSFIGIKVSNYARKKTPAGGSFHDRTGNLRSSIGYAVIKDGIIKEKQLEQVKQGAEGISAGEALMTELAETFPDGFVLVVTAGMEYAAAVESKGYDVITGGAQMGEKLCKQIKKMLGAS